MLGYTPPAPKLWKALIAVAPFVAFIAWSVPLFIHVHVPMPVLIGAAVVAWAGISAAVNARVSNDWRAQYEMNLGIADHRSSVGRNVEIGDK